VSPVLTGDAVYWRIAFLHVAWNARTVQRQGRDKLRAEDEDVEF